MLVVEDVLHQRCPGPSLTQTRPLQQRLLFFSAREADAEAIVCIYVVTTMQNQVMAVLPNRCDVG